MSDEPYDASDEKLIRSRIRAVKRQEDRKGRVIQKLMNDKEGREWAKSVLERCHVYSTSFSSDASIMAYSEGERNIGLFLMADLVKHAPQQYMLMLNEEPEMADDRLNDNE